ncbi:MAG: CDP-alcohol phosphatidyltransferase family protein [Gammaproteobacteria bacterium]|nr:CDP-alcohol phosphatidyltransferase family protein [Gammaproteobacteria bacterium]
MRHLPNLICLLRIGLIWPVVMSLYREHHALTLALFLLAAISDGVDGYLAKRFNWTSPLGRILDPLADKLLLVAVFLVATWVGLVPRWLTVAAVTRDFLIGFGALAFRIGWGPLRGRPTYTSKVNTLLQVVYVLLVIVRAEWGVPPAGVLAALAWLTLATVLLSGLGYVRQFTLRALQTDG